jgi:HTH-type transcriptional regulator/antitoxin HigA
MIGDIASITDKDFGMLAMIEHKGYHGCMEISLDDQVLRGQVVGIRDTITFQGDTVPQAVQAFRDSVDDYLAHCKEINKEPEKSEGDRYFARYVEIMKDFPLRPLQSDAELDNAIKILNGFLDRGIDNLNGDEYDYFDILGDLIHTYEETHDPLPPILPHESLRYLIEDAKQVSIAEVARQTKTSARTIRRILAGEQEMNIRHIKAFAKYFNVLPDAFL